MKDFVNLFKTDKVSDRIGSIVIQDYRKKMKKEWEKKQMGVSQYSTMFRRASSPLKLELQHTLREGDNVIEDYSPKGSAHSPMPGAEHFFAASGRSLETHVEVIDRAGGQLDNSAIRIQEIEGDAPDTKHETASSSGFGMPEAPDTTVFSFLGPEEASYRETKKLSSLLSEQENSKFRTTTELRR